MTGASVWYEHTEHGESLMTARIKLADGLILPAELAGRRTAVFGVSGSGKSNTATVIIEQLLAAGEQVVLVDPKGEGWGLLSAADGKPSKLPVIVFGEPNGHIQTLSESHGQRLADFVVESGRSVALSLLGFESDQSERRFVATFLRQLYRRKSRQVNPSRTLVVLEEAHLFTPEHVRGDAAELAGAVQRIVRQGRSFGLGTLLVDQRPQDVSKRVVTQCDTLICHQLVHKTDRDALREWVRGYDVDGRGEQFLESLAQLQPGEAWVWSPGWLKLFQRVTVNRRKTFDSGAAPDGSGTAKTVQRAEVDLEALRSQLAEVVEQATANDPTVLKRRVAELERQLKHRPATVDVKVERVEVPVLSLTDIERLLGVTADLRMAAGNIEAKIDAVKSTVAIPSLAKPSLPKAGQVVVRQKPNQFSQRTQKPANDSLPEGERKIMTAVAQRDGGATRETLTVLTGYKRSSRDSYIQRLRTRGYVIVGGDKVVATDDGIQALGSDFEPLPTGDALRSHWLDRLPEGEKKILEVLIANYPDTVDREAIDAEVGYKRSSRDSYLQRLRARQLVEFVGRGEVRASSDLFD